MSLTRRNATTAHHLEGRYPLQQSPHLPLSGSLAYAADEDLTVTAEEMKKPGRPERYTEAPTALYQMSVADFASVEFVTHAGKAVDKIDKVVTDTRETRGEAIITLQDGGKIAVPLGQLRIKNDKIALPARMMGHRSEIQAAHLSLGARPSAVPTRLRKAGRQS